LSFSTSRSSTANVDTMKSRGADAPNDAPQLRRLLTEIGRGDVLMKTRFDRLARSTRDLLDTLAAIASKEAGFRSLADAWADTTTAHGRLMLTVLVGLAEFERELIRARTAQPQASALIIKASARRSASERIARFAPDLYGAFPCQGAFRPGWAVDL
jgi:hypothetical protein